MNQEKHALAKILVKANSDFLHKRISDAGFQVENYKVKERCKIENFGPVEISNYAFQNIDSITLELEKENPGTTYQTSGIKRTGAYY